MCFSSHFPDCIFPFIKYDKFMHIVGNIKYSFFRHAHVGQVVSECNCIEATELAIAADHLLIDSLKPECFELISLQVTRNTVWTVLDTFFKFGLTDMASSCHEVIICLFFHYTLASYTN